jgi:U3 small nucleolar RNA-associated protein 15
MAAPVTGLQPVKLPAGPSQLTPEQQYWRTFRSQLLIPSPSSYAVTHISVPLPSPNSLNTASAESFVVTSGTRLQIFSSRTRQVTKTLSRFTDIAHSGEIRRDGRVVVAGDDSGLIQVFDTTSRAILKTWNEHKQPVWTTKFSPTDATTLMSASDDKTVRLWDLPSQSPIATLVGHEDYVRSGAFIPSFSSNLLVSGSYDGTVRIWDPRSASRSVMTFKHLSPVESVLPLPSGTAVLASSGSHISVLDMVAGKPLRLLQNHQKTITSLCLASSGNRVVSVGLDGHLKVFETTGWNVIAGSKYPSPILSVAIIPSGTGQDDKHVVVGMQSGILSIRTRLSGQQKVRERERQKEMKALIEGTVNEFDRKVAKKRGRGWERRFRGREFIGEGMDVIIEGNDRRRMRKETTWERDLRHGRYASALDRVLDGVCFSSCLIPSLNCPCLPDSVYSATISNAGLTGANTVASSPYHSNTPDRPSASLSYAISTSGS